MNPLPRIVFGFVTLLAVLAALMRIGPAHAAAADALGPGDSIRITVFQNPDLNTEARVSALGTIRMPLIGVIEVSGKSAESVAAAVAQRLREGQFLKDPEVNVSLLQMRSRQVSVLGQVGRPGRYALDENGARLSDILAQAGGITAAGDDTVTVLTQRRGTTEKLGIKVSSLYQNIDAAANLELENGDTVFVQRAPVFYIYGQVQRAGAYRLEPDLNVIQAVSLGGGITLRGTERGMRIHRRTADGGLVRIEAQPADRVLADDVIYVGESLF